MTREEAIEVYNGLINEKIKEAFEFFAPELAESEDEKIRKGLIEALKTSKTVGELKFIFPEPTREEAIVYLEKQKEQKHPNGCFTCDEYKKGYKAGRLNGFTAGYNKAMKEQKPAEWSEEDEDMLNSCISSIEEAKENRYAYKETDGDTSYDYEIAWLKSIRPSWKPSGEQMMALRRAVNKLSNSDVADSVRLSIMHDNLKKLM